MGEAVLSAAEVETLSRGNMHTNPVAKGIYDKRNARDFKVQAVKLFVHKLLPATLRAAHAKEQEARAPIQTE
jgi:hypothetical protein